MPDLASVAYRHPAVILKMAAGVDKHILTHTDIFAEIGIERRENAERLRHSAAE